MVGLKMTQHSYVWKSTKASNQFMTHVNSEDILMEDKHHRHFCTCIQLYLWLCKYIYMTVFVCIWQYYNWPVFTFQRWCCYHYQCNELIYEQSYWCFVVVAFAIPLLLHIDVAVVECYLYRRVVIVTVCIYIYICLFFLMECVSSDMKWGSQSVSRCVGFPVQRISVFNITTVGDMYCIARSI